MTRSLYPWGIIYCNTGLCSASQLKVVLFGHFYERIWLGRPIDFPPYISFQRCKSHPETSIEVAWTWTSRLNKKPQKTNKKDGQLWIFNSMIDRGWRRTHRPCYEKAQNFNGKMHNLDTVTSLLSEKMWSFLMKSKDWENHSANQIKP